MPIKNLKTLNNQCRLRFYNRKETTCGKYIELTLYKAGISADPEDYRWGIYSTYPYGKNDPLVEFSPEYLGISEDEEERRSVYRDFIRDGMKRDDKRSLNRYFRAGVCGSREFAESLRRDGLVPAWSHSGRPGEGKKQ